ncbi:Hypothetical predicted protein [Paramuricea clavata]|uniref:Uncharacterized protein n=1 Tax=Paramuricea clavata TaxID=317549 RepID=A0A7D9E900_PARCT|nr:Hypothetical predicted protein [Paramuricea clavata]
MENLPDEADSLPDEMESLPDEAESSPDEAESSPDEAKSSPDEMENLPKRRVSQTRLTPDIWADVPIQRVENLPYDIDGLKVYSLEYDSGNKTAVTEDGRQWDSLVDRQTLKKMKQSAKEKLDPVGHSYDAVMKYKTKVQDVLKDPFLIYKVDCEKQIVFKTSREQLQLAMEMDRDGQGHLNVEPCHVDGKHNRVTGYITISLVVYNPNLREMTKIATMECPTESKENIGIFWDCLNTALQQFTGDNKYVFKPHLYVFDEGGGFWASLQEQLGTEEINRAVSCDRHWGFSVDRNAKKLIGEDLRKEYRFLSDSVLKASTKNMYDKAKAALEKFIDNNPFLNNWWKWWEAQNLTLIQACREDVAESVKLKRRVEGYEVGAYKGGRGPSVADLQRRRHVDQKKQAEAFCKELDDYVEKGEDLLHQRSFLNSELESITEGRDGKAPTSKTLSATTINTATATAANTPTTTMAAKDFRNPDLTKQQWCISRVVSRGRTPACKIKLR